MIIGGSIIVNVICCGAAKEGVELADVRRCFAAFSGERDLYLRFHRRLPSTAAPQLIAGEPPNESGRSTLTKPGLSSPFLQAFVAAILCERLGASHR